MNDSHATQRREWPTRLVFPWLIGLGFVLGMAAVFVDLVEDVRFSEGFWWDAPLIIGLHHLGHPWLDTAMRLVTQMGEAGAIAVVIVLTGWFVYHHRSLDAATVVVSFIGAVALNTLLKVVLARPRPILFPPLVVESGFSFPSGHVTASVAAYGTLAVFLWRQGHRGWAVVAAAWVPMVAASRVYLGVHYPSDTLGSLLFASLWLLVVFAVRDAYARRQQPASEIAGFPS